MSEHHVRVSGKILHVFAHRFVVQTAKGAILADVAPKGIEQIALHVGDEVWLEGEMKPSELKVLRRRDGAFVKLHIELDGHIRKTKPVSHDTSKWEAALRAT